LKLRLVLCLSLALWGVSLALGGSAEGSKLKMHKPDAPVRRPPGLAAASLDSSLSHTGRLPFRDYFGLPGEAGAGGRAAVRAATRSDWFSGASAVARAAGRKDTVRVLAVRVDFLTDRGGSETTTPDGKFDLRSVDQVEAPWSLVDPPPHNKDYFLAHLKSLANYYEAQSHGQLVLEYEVYPEGQDEAYHLSDTMDYGPWAISQDSIIVREARDVFIDSIELADSESDIDFSDFDAYIVFHAGPDFQSDINYDSQRDIPSYTIPLFEDSVAVNGGSHYVHMGMVMPETTSQDTFLGALNGVLAHEFGHVLGLPDLYDINTLYPVVGDFSLMDTGATLQGVLEDPDSGDLYAVYGLLPSSLDLWSKAVLWPETIDLEAVEDEADVELEASETSPKGLFILINSEEYFLIENRQVDLDGDLTVVLRADSTTGVVLGPDNDEYDFLLPGLGGVLIWHIDESAIFGRNVGPYYGVNTNYRRRGIRLMEADGIYDIGNIYSIYFTGSAEEPFYLGNNTLFSADTDPASNSNGGGCSHITVEVTDPSQKLMHVRARREWGRQGWPVWLDAPLAEGSVWAGVLTGGAKSIAFVTADSVLYLAEPQNNWRNFAVKLPAAPVPGLSGRPKSSGSAGLVYASVPGTGVIAFDYMGATPASWRPDVSSVCTSPAVTETGILVGLEDGEIASLDSTGRTVWKAGGGGGAVVSPIVVADIDGDSSSEIAFATEGGSVWVLEGDGSTADGWPVQWRSGVVWMTAGDMDRDETAQGMELVLADSTGHVEVLGRDGVTIGAWQSRGVRLNGSRPALGDVDGDGYLECAFVSEDGNLYLLNHNAAGKMNWPYKLDTGSAPDSIGWASSPVMTDVDEDGLPEVLVGSLKGDVVAVDGDGTVCEGWPYSFGLPVRATPLVSDLYGEGTMTILTSGDDAVIHSLFLPVGLSGEADAPWARYGRDLGVSNAFPLSLMTQTVVASELMPEGSVYVYPSPVVGDRAFVRYTLSEPAEVVATVVDIKGQEVASLRQSGEPEENELEWNTEKVGAGLYFVRVVALGSKGRTQARTVKVAVAR
jgi:M6 family metalloprotease-like protein